MMKRLADIVLSTVGLILLSPLLAVLALAIKLEDGGPVIYRGARVGRYGKQFAMYKFRSMRVVQTVKSEVTVQGDPRVTRVGRFLRATKLDETLQLLNVFRGEMGFVGPRPEAPHYVAYYTPEQRAVLNVRPGITGPAQVYFRHEEHLLAVPDPEEYYIQVIMPAKLRIDLDYARHASLGRDAIVVLRTLVALVRPPAPPALPPYTSIVITGKRPAVVTSGGDSDGNQS
jgi:lipopolysaccharide/colanic/teichoic acid biosynthesis glycosyltransferase